MQHQTAVTLESHKTIDKGVQQPVTTPRGKQPQVPDQSYELSWIRDTAGLSREKHKPLLP